MSSRVALPVLIWSTSAAGGEEPPADQPVIELEVVTVTATKTERSAFEVPASVSIIGPERIEAEQPQSINLPQELPNVELVSGARRIGETANLRGSGCRAQRFRDRARVRRIPLLRGHELETRGWDATKGEPLMSVPPDKLVATLGLRLPELGLVFNRRGRFVQRRDEVPARVPVIPGYGVCDGYASWLPEGAGYSGLRFDFGSIP